VTGSGERIVLVHGFTQTGRSFDAIAARLSRSFEVCAVDLPGHGRSSKIVATDLDHTAHLVGGAGGAATYVGYSLGGRVCLTLALARPDLVRRLILVGATAGIVDREERAARRTSDERLADRLAPTGGDGLSIGTFLDEWLAQPLFAHLSPEQADRPSRLANIPAGLAHSLRSAGVGAQTPSYDRLGALAMATLLVAGERDTKFTTLAYTMAAAIGDRATVVLMPGAGHAVPFEEPTRFVTAIEQWIDQTS
jgi:2-succinyl-6-hydroxy-2,4-cyclohexadiene-1-carboxylate synthase